MGFRRKPMVVINPLVDKEQLFTPEIRQRIDRWIAKYPKEWRQSAVMAALRIVMEENGGWLTPALMDDVAAYLDMAPVAVYEVATFYSMYELEPIGKHKLCVCTNISCMINGSDEIVDHLEEKLDIKMGQTTEDNRFTLKEVECLGACGGAPAMQVGKEYYENLTLEQIDQLLEELE